MLFRSIWNARGATYYITLIVGLFFTLGFVHLLLFLFHRSKISNLFYAIFAICIGLMFNMVIGMQEATNPDAGINYNFWSGILWSIIPVSLLALLYNLFYQRYILFFKIMAGLYVIQILSICFHLHIGMFLAVLLGICTCVEFIRIVIWSIWKKKEGAWIIGAGLFGFVFLFVGLFLFVLFVMKGFENVDWNKPSGVAISLCYLIGMLGIPLSMSVYLARDFAQTSKKLSKKLIELEELSQKSLEQEKEKQKILATQNETLERQVTERTSEILEQKNIVEEKQKEILDSIRYAKRIQTALMSNEKYIAKQLRALKNIK